MSMTFKDRLDAPGARLSGAVCVIPSAVVTQALAAAGLDYVILDQEHAPTGMETLHAMIAATQGTRCAPIVRIPSIDEVAAKRALDAGAEGICFPLVRSAEDARRCVASLRYPPEGVRGFGPFVSHSRWGVSMAEYFSGPARKVVSMLLIETKEAVDAIEEIAAVDGVDCMVVAGFDLSVNLGVAGQFENPAYLAAVARIEGAAMAAGVPLGTNAHDPAAAAAAFGKGYRLIAGFDLLWLKNTAAGVASWAAPA